MIYFPSFLADMIIFISLPERIEVIPTRKRHILHFEKQITKWILTVVNTII